MPRPFRGEIKLDVRESTADWDAFLADKAPEGAPNVLVVLYDDTGQAAWSPYGGRINMPTMDRLAANGLTYTQWHTTALCSPTRSTLLTGRNHHLNGFATISESSTGFPGYNSHIPPENATMANVLRDARVVDVLGGQEPQRAHRRVDDGRLQEELAPRPGLRPLLRLHRRRDQQLVSEPGRGQPLHRPALPPRGRLPPVQGPGRPGAAVHPRLQADRARQALVPVVLPGRQPRPAPRARGVHRQVQGHVRRRLRGVPRVGAAPHDRARDPAGGHRAHPDEPDGGRHVHPARRRAALGRARRRREGDVLAHGRGLRRVQRVHRRPGRPHRRLPGGLGPARQHDHLLLRRQRGLGRGQPQRLGQRGEGLRRLPRRPRAEPDDGRPARLARHLQPLPDRLGHGVLHAVPHVQALHVPGRRVRPAGHPLAGGHRVEGRGAQPVPPLDGHRPHHLRRVRRRDAGRLQRRRPEPALRRLDALLVRRRRRARPRSTRSTTRCWAHGASGTTGGRPSPNTGR